MRCFIAAWPNEAVRARCAALIAELRPHAEHGRVMRPQNLHLTFAFIGDLADEAGADVAAACSTLRIERIGWRLDEIGVFRRPRVLWAGGKATAALDDLAHSCRALLDELRVAYDRKPFVPHVTLLRDVVGYSGPTTITAPIEWPIDDVALFRSGKDAQGARYVRVGT